MSEGDRSDTVQYRTEQYITYCIRVIKETHWESLGLYGAALAFIPRVGGPLGSGVREYWRHAFVWYIRVLPAMN